MRRSRRYAKLDRRCAHLEDIFEFTMLCEVTETIAIASLAYVGFAVGRVAMFRARTFAPDGELPPVSVLKPVCGLEKHLYENLRSFCDQDYPQYQIIFGISDHTDPALPVIERVIKDFPDKDISIRIDNCLVGSNRKVSNLANMYSLAKYDLLVIADSDMQVGIRYLRNVIAPFDDERVGAVTCLYTGMATAGLASALGALFISEWFLPSVLVALTFRDPAFCFGATMAVRRELLERIGGFPTLSQVIADDYMLGKWISALGFRVHLVPYLVKNVVYEPDLKTLFLHELRWARTVRSVQPIGYSLSFLTYAIPTALLFCIFSTSSVASASILTAAILLRVLMHYTTRRCLDIDGPSRLWLVPIRDLFSFVVWGASFFGRTVRWRQDNFSIQDDNQMVLMESAARIDGDTSP
jgi:ceramide glucosyltransferase